MSKLTPTQKDQLLDSREDIDWFSFAQAIRNSFGLWEGNESLIDSCGMSGSEFPEDNASSVIIDTLLKRIAQERSRDGEPNAGIS